MFCLLRNGWDETWIYGVDPVNNKFLIYEYGRNWKWVPMDEFTPIA